MGIILINRQRKHAINKPDLSAFGARVLVTLAQLNGATELADKEAAIAFVSDRVMRRYNRAYRGKDRPTDVLSFPADSSEPEFANYLGDIVISTDTAARDAQELSLTFEIELRMLIIHGLLHLCGYDHESDRGEMSRLERRLRQRLLPSNA